MQSLVSSSQHSLSSCCKSRGATGGEAHPGERQKRKKIRGKGKRKGRKSGKREKYIKFEGEEFFWRVAP